MPKTAEKIKNCSGNVNNQVGLFIFRKQAVAMIQALLTEPRHQKHMKVISFFFLFRLFKLGQELLSNRHSRLPAEEGLSPAEEDGEEYREAEEERSCLCCCVGQEVGAV